MLKRLIICGVTVASFALGAGLSSNPAAAQIYYGDDYGSDGPYSFGGPYRDCGWGFGGCNGGANHNGPLHGFYNAGDDYPYFYHPHRYHHHYRRSP